MRTFKSIMLVALICIAFCGITLSLEAKAADQWEGYIAVSTKEELNAVRNNLSGKYYLTADIVFTEEDFAVGGAFYNNGAFWVPIGTNKSRFSGIFNGNGYTISGLKVNGTNYAGLFGYARNAVISNLGMINGDIKGTSYAGSVIGYADYGTTIEKCYNTGKVSAAGGSTNVGGIAGFSCGKSSSYNYIYNCYNTGEITSVVSSDATIVVGGIVGATASGRTQIGYCFNTGNVSAIGSKWYSNAGGIAGSAGNGTSIYHSYNAGSVIANVEKSPYDWSSSYAYAGGIVSSVSSGHYDPSSIKYCYNVGTVLSTGESSGGGAKYAGGILGNGADVADDCYYLDTAVGESDSTTVYATACTAEQLKQQETYVFFDFETIWKMSNSAQHPYPMLITNDQTELIMNSAVKNADLKFKSATLTLYNNISLNFNVRKSVISAGAYSYPMVAFEFMGKKTIVTDFTETQDLLVFEFADIYSYLMDETVKATLYASAEDGELYRSETVEYSVAKYCYNRLEKSTDDKMKTLAVDILNYGAASQVYFGYNTDALVNARLTPEQKLLASSDAELKDVTNTEHEVIAAPYVSWCSAALVLENSITIRYRIETSSIYRLKLELTNGVHDWTIDSSEFESNGDGTYYIYFSGLNATQFFDTIYATLYDESAAVSNTLTYSIESYAYSKQNSETPGLAELAKCIMRYGSSAKAYFEGM